MFLPSLWRLCILSVWEITTSSKPGDPLSLASHSVVEWMSGGHPFPVLLWRLSEQESDPSSMLDGYKSGPFLGKSLCIILHRMMKSLGIIVHIMMIWLCQIVIIWQCFSSINKFTFPALLGFENSEEVNLFDEWKWRNCVIAMFL